MSGFFFKFPFQISKPVQCYGFDDGIAFASATGGTTPYSFVWDNPLNPPTGPNINNLTPGIHTVYVTDANGCTLSSTFNVVLNVAPCSITNSENAAILFLLCRFGRVFKIFGRRRCLCARLVHLLARALFDALLFGVNVGVKPRFRCHVYQLPIQDVATAPRS